MSNAVYPNLVGKTWPLVKQPAYNTKIQRAVSGKEYRAAFMQFPLWSFTLAYDVLRDSAALLELQTLCGFFLARQGSYDSFLYDDTSDDTVASQNFGTGGGGATVFPLVRTYGAGGFTAYDLVQNVNVIGSITNNGTPVVAGATADEYHYTIDSVGNITFGAAPTTGHALVWTGTYRYRCRFLADTLDFNNFMSGLWDLKQLQFIGSPQNKVGP